MARPDLGTKRLCPNCGAKYYDLNRDPIICPKCNALFATGVVAARLEPEENEEVDADDEGVELVALEDAEETGSDTDDDTDGITTSDDEEDVTVDADEDALIDDDDDDEVSDVVRATDEDDEES